MTMSFGVGQSLEGMRYKHFKITESDILMQYDLGLEGGGWVSSYPEFKDSVQVNYANYGD